VLSAFGRPTVWQEKCKNQIISRVFREAAILLRDFNDVFANSDRKHASIVGFFLFSSFCLVASHCFFCKNYFRRTVSTGGIGGEGCNMDIV
jgi:hypothetical protein